MQSAFEASNPFEFWAKAQMAAMAATVEFLTTTAASSMLRTEQPEAVGSAGRRAVARPAYEVRPAERARPASTSTGRSWYRAPYRSPFDPLFWMTPGHPVDHVGDWMRPAMAAGAALGNPFATPFASPFMPPFGSALPDWQSAAWMSPLAIWANMMPAASPDSAARRSSTNVVDFETAYAAYRTAGGHASAQVTREPLPSRGFAAIEPCAPAWGLPFLMFGWPPRFS